MARLRALLPRWFGDNPPLLTGLLQGFAAAYSYVYSLIAYARLQTRISTAIEAAGFGTVFINQNWRNGVRLSNSLRSTLLVAPFAASSTVASISPCL